METRKSAQDLPKTPKPQNPVRFLQTLNVLFGYDCAKFQEIYCYAINCVYRDDLCASRFFNGLSFGLCIVTDFSDLLLELTLVFWTELITTGFEKVYVLVGEFVYRWFVD